jgi:hypothetical protein
MIRAVIPVAVLSLLSAMAIAQARSAPFTETFDDELIGTPLPCYNRAALGGWTYPTGWGEDPTTPATSRAWRTWAGSTTTGGTGPYGDHTVGSGTYMYCETSTTGLGHPWSTFHLITPAVDTSGLSVPGVSFWYHMFGEHMGTLTVEEHDGAGGWNPVLTLTGNSGNAWHHASAPLRHGETRVRFAYVSGSGMRGDIAIDDVTFGERPLPQWETNGPKSRLDLQGDAIGSYNGPVPMWVNAPGTPATLMLDSILVGSPFDIAVQMLPAVPAAGGGLSLLPGYQAVNLIVATPLSWLGGGGATSRPIPFPGAFSLPFSAPAMPGVTLSAQMYVVDPANPDGIALSRAVQLSIAP